MGDTAWAFSREGHRPLQHIHRNNTEKKKHDNLISDFFLLLPLLNVFFKRYYHITVSFLHIGV